jgi:hypothetical protein
MRLGTKEYRQFVGIARGSAGEVCYQLLLAKDLCASSSGSFESDKRFEPTRTSSLLKNSGCRLLKRISEARRAKNRRAEAYLAGTL